jgi:hypothetical protein
LTIRHTLKPLARHIPDEQIALYVEERNPDFEGALMSAAEFGPARGVSEEQQAIIDAIIAEAVARAERFDVRSAIDLSRLKKYGAAAAAAVLVYLAIGLVAPKGLGRHAARVLVPWRAGAGGVPDHPGAEEGLGPITFALSSYDTRLLRGTPFELDAELSRTPAESVLFHFRPLAEMSEAEEAPAVGPAMPFAPVIGDGEREHPAWRTLAMEEIEKLHGYRIALPDVNEDLAFYVSAGAFGSDVHRIEVYDPLRLEGFEITTRFPEYLRLNSEPPEETSEQPTGDVSAPVGSTVTVRIMTNGRLEGGKLIWADGEEQELEVASGQGTSAAASFPVQKDRSYNFTVRDINGQVRDSPMPSLVRAIEDSPPILEILAPKIDISTHPLAEVAFRVEAKDDWGVASVGLVYRVGIEEEARPVRVPLNLEPKGPAGRRAMTTVEASHDMLFEEFEPALDPGDLMTYHFEVRDGKQNLVMSDIFFISVKPFEVWGTWLPLPPEEGAGGEMPYVPAVVERYTAAAWHLHAQKGQLSKEEYERACEKLADEFTAGGVNLWDYVREPP